MNFETSNDINFTNDLTSSAIARSEASTSFLIQEFCPHQNSFDVCEMSLQNIVTGLILSDNDTDQLVNARDIGLNEMKIFVKKKRVISNSESFGEIISLLNVSRFE